MRSLTRYAPVLLLLGFLAGGIPSDALAQSFTGSVAGNLATIQDTGILTRPGQSWTITASGVVDLHTPGPHLKTNVAGILTEGTTFWTSIFNNQRPGGFPAGSPNPLPTDHNLPAPGQTALMGALLIGRIDPDNPNRLLNPQQVFFGNQGAGPFTTVYTSPFSGRIGLQINDDRSDDNTGAFTIEIQPTAQQFWDPAASFSAGENPGSVWSYFMRSNGFELFQKPLKVEGLDAWTVSSPFNKSEGPAVLKNTTEEPITLANEFTVAPGQLLLHPANGASLTESKRASVQWTSPISGHVSVHATFKKLNPSRPAWVWIVHHRKTENTELFANSTFGSIAEPPPFHVVVEEGDVIEFIAGFGEAAEFPHNAVALEAMIFESSTTTAAEYKPIDIAPLANYNIRSPEYPGLPVGPVTLGGIPFNLLAGEWNTWHSHFAEGENPRFIDIPVNLEKVGEVHTLINTYWGQPGPNSYVTLEFFGHRGAYYKKDLVGNVDIRDFNPNPQWTNTINLTTSIAVYGDGGKRLDKQAVVLPEAFLNEDLVKIRFSDTGRQEFQRAFLVGVTARTQGKEVPVTRPEVTKPKNDNIADALVLQGNGGSVTGETHGATREESFLGSNKGETGKRTVWYKWVAPYTADVAFRTFEPDFDTILRVSEAKGLNLDPNDFDLVKQDDNSGINGVNSYLRFTAQQDRIYYISVDRYKRATGRFTLQWGMANQVIFGPVNHKITHLCVEVGCDELGVIVKKSGPDQEGEFIVTVKGTGFTPDALVMLAGAGLENNRTKFINSGELQASIPRSYLTLISDLRFQVLIGKEISNSLLLAVREMTQLEAPPGGTAE
ncbi:MAG: hypothetical protein KY468_20140, partial [Armatimonadetes bacterium]|nr:hypothetical protein [Armatimonadota bacterium]